MSGGGREIIRKFFYRFVFAIGLAAILVGGYRLLWPILDAEGSITSGQYRGIYIGEAKVDVEIAVSIPGRQQLKLSGYVDSEGHYKPIDCYENLRESDKWTLLYPGIHQEVVILTFRDQRVVQIEYKRDMLSP